jgi:uncharacterized membrane protein YhaH (DUF805 family)
VPASSIFSPSADRIASFRRKPGPVCFNLSNSKWIPAFAGTTLREVEATRAMRAACCKTAFWRTRFRFFVLMDWQSRQTSVRENMNWYLEVLKKYAVFDGRARRSEYWYFVLFNVIAAVILALFDGVIRKMTGFGLLGTLYSLAVLLPGIGVSIRRLHDTNRSGWWLLLALVPLVGLVLIWFFAQDSDSASNHYGTNPKMSVA